ncbi:MAG: universal stress protein [Acetobacteraceae bacterium]|nr:universal stress protein [Acetobacteraceae bacterium]
MHTVILVLLGHPEAAPGLLRAAECLAELAGGAGINALAVRTPLGLTPLLADASVPESVLAALRATEREREAALKSAFNAWAAGARAAPLQAQWCCVEADPCDAIEERGSRADFILAARPMADDDWPLRQGFHAALFRTGRPVLVVPPDRTAAFGRRVAIAWRDDGRAVKAVLPALRCLARAEQVLLLCGVREGAPPPGIPGILQEHGIEAELHLLPIGPGVFGERLLAEAHRLGADLLVMGAFAHSPLWEMILGGVTHYMLAHADLPVLMRH